MDNPIQEHIGSLNLTPRAFAVFNGLSPDTLRAALNGKVQEVPTAIAQALQQSGVDVSELDHHYSAWLLWRAQEDVRHLKQTRSEEEHLHGRTSG